MGNGGDEWSVLDWLSGGEAAKGKRQGASRRVQKREKLSLKCPVPSVSFPAHPAKRVESMSIDESGHRLFPTLIISCAITRTMRQRPIKIASETIGKD